MATMSVSKHSITVSRGLLVDHYDHSKHTVFEIHVEKAQENDIVSDIITSSDCKHMALITSTSKKLLVYDLPFTDKYKSFDLPRSASKIRFGVDNQQILVADKTGDALVYNLKDTEPGTKLLGHLSLLLDILQTSNGKYIITSDRDEKIRVSCYPNTYNTHTYCLGHKEFVNHIELLPHDEKYLVSTSGDGHIKLWNYSQGKLLHSIDTFTDINDEELKEKFTKAMDLEGVEVNALPIVHFTSTKLNKKSSLLAAAVHSFNKILLYVLDSHDDKFSHRFVDTISLYAFPTAIQFLDLHLFIYNDADSKIRVFEVSDASENVSVSLDRVIVMFGDKPCDTTKASQDAIKVLYKRKFDNVQEYQERKRQRLEKSGQK